MTKETKKRGAKKGLLAVLLSTCANGETFFINRSDKDCTASASYHGVNITTERWIGIHPNTRQTVELTRVKMEGEAEKDLLEFGDWINIHERSPKRGQLVLTFNNTTGIQIAYINVADKWKQSHTEMDLRVIKWMPLPEIPNF